MLLVINLLKFKAYIYSYTHRVCDYMRYDMLLHVSVTMRLSTSVS